jgi:hypothetical protein
VKDGTTTLSPTSIASREAGEGREGSTCATTAAERIVRERLAELLAACPAPSADQARRCFGAIVGFFAADAAAQPSHWVYELSRLAGVLRERGQYERPEFASPALNGFYSLPIGSRTCYADQAWVLAQHLLARAAAASTGGAHVAIQPEQLEEEFSAAFGVGGSLGYGPLESTTGLTREQMPIDGCVGRGTEHARPGRVVGGGSGLDTHNPLPHGVWWRLSPQTRAASPRLFDQRFSERLETA